MSGPSTVRGFTWVTLLMVKLQGVAFKADPELAESWPGARALAFLLVFFDVLFCSSDCRLVDPTLFLGRLRGALFSLV